MAHLLNRLAPYGLIAWRVAEMAIVVMITLAVWGNPLRVSSAQAIPPIASVAPRPAFDEPELGVTGVYQATRSGVVYLVGIDYAPSAFASAGPASDIPGLGSAFVVDDQGDAITNHHVVAGKSAVRAVLADGTTVVGRVLGRRSHDRSGGGATGCGAWPSSPAAARRLGLFACWAAHDRGWQPVWPDSNRDHRNR